MKKVIIILILFIMLTASVFSAEKLQPCESGGLTTSVFKDFQMIYTDEDFLRIDNKDLLKDIEQLKDLTCLQYLDLTDLGVKGDISNLKNLVNLEVLSLYSNPDVYGDICALKDLNKLRVLKFAFDPKVYGDISCLKNLNLETFAMTYTNISGKLSDVNHMDKLKAIYVSGTGISGDISSLSGLVNIEELGISDEYPGNPNIFGNLASLDNLKNLKKVSLYSTRTTNCEHFSEMHPNIAQGGCSKDSLKTLRIHNIRAEKKIGKDRYYGPPPDYGENEANNISDKRQGMDEVISKKEGNIADNKNILDRFFNWIKGLFEGKKVLPLDVVIGISPAKDLDGPPADCVIDGNFIGEKKCREMVEKGGFFAEQGVSGRLADDDGPPAECTISGSFIGEEKCKAMIEGKRPLENAQNKGLSPNGPDNGPPKECTIDGKFIGEAGFKAMMEKGNTAGGEGKGWCQTEEECDKLIKENLYGKK